MCVSPGVCGGQGSSGQNGGMQGMQQALQQAMQMLQQLMQGGGGGGGGSPSGGGGSGSGGTGAPGGCTNYYNVTTPSSDPCAVYIPPVSGGLGSTTSSGSSAANDLISSLLSGSYGNSNQTPNPGNGAGNGNSNAQSANTSGSGTVQTNGSTQYVVATSTTYVPTPAAPGVSGDIQYSNDSVTVLVNNVDQKSGTQVAGFYGTDAGGQPTSVIATMCQARPWATNFLSFIIPSSFFDSLCQLRGYKVGTPAAPAPAVSSHPSAEVVTHAQATTTAATSTGPYVPPEADIWAVPAAVPLGSRTTVFWNAKGVVSCTETSPDGSFSQSTLSGGAATVPLSGATTYTISCITPSNDHVTNYVTVNLSAN